MSTHRTARLVIAVDGPSASGKGTLAKRLAAHFRLPHLDTGLLYRAVGWRALQTGQAPAEVAARLTAADLADPALRTDDAGQPRAVERLDVRPRADGEHVAGSHEVAGVDDLAAVNQHVPADDGATRAIKARCARSRSL